MNYENRGNVRAKEWDTNKEMTPEEKFAKLFDEFKTDVIRSGILRKLKEKRYYIKPSQVRRQKIAEQKMKAKQNLKRRNQR